MCNTIRQLALRMAATLDRHGIPDSRLEAEVLLRHALQYDRARYYASLNESISAECIELGLNLTERRINREPLPYITGHREFYGLDFIVSPAVLIPRQETELLVDAALEFARERPGDISIADVGTGSGAIAIAIAANLPSAHVYATDRSADALQIADLNCRKNGVSDRITLLEGDLLAPLPKPVDLIISNPPYIASHLLPGLAPEVQREPGLALDGGKKGLEIISRLLEQAPSKLKAGGSLMLEISPEQLDKVRDMAQIYFSKPDVCHTKDLIGLPRCVIVSTM